LRILYLVFYYFPRASAATWSTYNITKRLAERNEVRLIFPNVGYETELGAVEAVEAVKGNRSKQYRTPRFKIPEGLAQVVAPFFVFKEGLRRGVLCDVVVCQFQPHHFVFLSGLAVGRLLHLPVVARANDVYRSMGEKLSLLQKLNMARRRTFSAVNESLIRWADAFLVVCEENWRQVESRVGRLKNIGLSHNGVDLNDFMDLDAERSRRLLAISVEEKVILFTGRFSGEEYMVDVLIDAYAIVKRDMPDAALILVGDKLSPMLSRRASELNVRVVGHIPHDKVLDYLAAADVCVGPIGQTQAMPIKVLEYMAAGKPVVTGVGSVSGELAEDGVNCITAESNPEAIATALKRALTDEHLRVKLVSNAYNSVKAFSWDNVVSELEATLERIVERGTASSAS